MARRKNKSKQKRRARRAARAQRPSSLVLDMDQWFSKLSPAPISSELSEGTFFKILPYVSDRVRGTMVETGLDASQRGFDPLGTEATVLPVYATDESAPVGIVFLASRPSESAVQWAWIDPDAKSRNVLAKGEVELDGYPDQWHWAEQRHGRVTVARYRPEQNVVEEVDPTTGTVTTRTDFEVRREVIDEQRRAHAVRTARSVLGRHELRFVGVHDGVAVVFDPSEEELLAVDTEAESQLWSAPTHEKVYSVLHRDTVVSVREEYVYVRDLRTGARVVDDELESASSWAYRPPVVFRGGLYLTTQDGGLWRLHYTRGPDVDSRTAERVERASFHDVFLAKESSKVPFEAPPVKQTVRDALRARSELSQKSRFSSAPLFRFAVPYFRCTPVVVGDRLYVYGQAPKKRSQLKAFLGGERVDRSQPMQLVLWECEADDAATCFDWLFAHLEPREASALAQRLPDPHAPATLLGGYTMFAQGLESALLRSRVYFEHARLDSFHAAYSHVRLEDTSGLDPRLKGLSTEEVFDLIYTASAGAYPFRSFPSWDDFFFGGRQEVFGGVEVDGDRAAPAFSEDILSERGLFLQEEVHAAGGLALMAYTQGGDVSIFNRLTDLPSDERALIYEENYLRTGQMNRLLANNTGWAFFQAGRPDLAVFYLFLTSFFPYESADDPASDHNYITAVPYLLRAVYQLHYLGRPGVREALLRQLDAGGGFVVDGLRQDFSFFFGGAGWGEEHVQRELAAIDRSLAAGDLDEAVRRYRLLSLTTEALLGDIENEALQTSVVARYLEGTRALVDASVAAGDTDTALRVYDDTKAQVLRLYLSAGNRAALLERLETAPFYTERRGAARARPGRGEERGAAPAPHQDGRGERLGSRPRSQLSRTEGYSELPELPEGTALVEFFVGDGEKGAFVVRDGCTRFVPLPDVGAAPRIWRSAAQAVQSAGSALGARDLIEDRLRRLHVALLGPLSDALEGAEDLVVVPTGDLFSVPFTALLDADGVPLLDEHRVTVAPSAAVYGHCCRRPYVPPGSAVLLRAATSDLPSVEREEGALRGLFGEHITVATSLDDLRSSVAGALHVATHGHFNSREPLLSSLDLGGTSVSVLDLYGVDLEGAEFAVVNACVTGVAEIRGGDDPFGLVRGFLTAGCPTVVNTLWNLHDEAAAAFATSFYEEIGEGQPPGTAFASAVLEMAASEYFSHPYYWAGYQHYGRL